MGRKYSLQKVFNIIYYRMPSWAAPNWITTNWITTNEAAVIYANCALRFTFYGALFGRVEGFVVWTGDDR